MARRTFIKVKRGLLEAKHVHILGVRYPMYIWFLDRANWESGKILFYRDSDLADEFEMPLRTIREWRRKLEEDDYIICVQVGNHQEIIINKWTDPRGGDDINPLIENGNGDAFMEPLSQEGDAFMEPEGSKNMEPCGEGYIEGDIQGYIEGSRKHVTLPISDIRYQTSHNKVNLLYIHQTIMDYFINDCKFQKPKIPSGTYDIAWEEPINEMLDLTKDNTELCKQLIKKAIERADQNHLAITTPKSLLKIFTAIVSETERKKANEKDQEFVAAEFLNGH